MSGARAAEVGLVADNCASDFASLLPNRLKESSRSSWSLLLAFPTGPDGITYVGSTSVPDVPLSKIPNK